MFRIAQCLNRPVRKDADRVETYVVYAVESASSQACPGCGSVTRNNATHQTELSFHFILTCGQFIPALQLQIARVKIKLMIGTYACKTIEVDRQRLHQLASDISSGDWSYGPRERCDPAYGHVPTHGRVEVKQVRQPDQGDGSRPFVAEPSLFGLSSVCLYGRVL